MSAALEDREALLGNVREDPDLTPAEKETAVHFAKDEDLATVYTAEAGITRRVLAHPHAEIEAVTVRDGNARPAVSPAEAHDHEIVGVRARLPVGALKVGVSVRSTDQHAPVVSKRVFDEEVEGE